MSIPIITVHGGNVWPHSDQSYVGIGAKQALLYNPRFILLGGPENKHLSSVVEWYNYFKDYSRAANRFAKHAYRKLSFYLNSYDLAVLKRYFVLREFMSAHAIPWVFHCDSDTMIYCDVTREAARLDTPDVAFCIPAEQPRLRLSASSHFSYFTQEGISDLCEFIIHNYTDPSSLARLEEKWAWHRVHKEPGGVCDMTHLYLYSREHQVTNLSRVANSTAFDHHVNTPENYYPDEYRMSHTKRKQITWLDNQPYGYNTHLDALVRFNAIHLQGRATKKLAGDYVRPRAVNY